ncbi:hypothetical protein HYFRA_00006184 [Hymenoscyphus fraxineus]|uniref:BZIP domain-containing protein n=1 Tax=Hymenoscyphus fraxineus TaxID=746836 RepID=A0A9N9LDU5_9HELO|nr:hypothetical protein HYFRA_00006184 [Hymenoscyphus fraxineus]
MAPTSAEKANLARIRDNQRRSRARRKEYLQELEIKLRQCENIGVEASTELQTAARRVARENKRLRELLAQKGVDDDSIEEYLNRPPLTGSANDRCRERGSGNVLERLIQARKPCCPVSTIPIPVPPTRGNVNSCDLATDMITSMAGGDPAAVRADLGCLPGMECEVDNQLVFQVMDQYSNSLGLQ